MGCIVCGLRAGWCEFCPGDGNVVTDNDPGDETQEYETAGELYSPGPNNSPSYFPPLPFPSRPRPFSEPIITRITARSYKATYQIADTFFTRTIIAPDSFLDAVHVAEGQREEGETLVNVTELT